MATEMEKLVHTVTDDAAKFPKIVRIEDPRIREAMARVTKETCMDLARKVHDGEYKTCWKAATTFLNLQYEVAQSYEGKKETNKLQGRIQRKLSKLQKEEPHEEESEPDDPDNPIKYVVPKKDLGPNEYRCPNKFEIKMEAEDVEYYTSLKATITPNELSAMQRSKYYLKEPVFGAYRERGSKEKTGALVAVFRKQSGFETDVMWAVPLDCTGYYTRSGNNKAFRCERCRLIVRNIRKANLARLTLRRSYIGKPKKRNWDAMEMDAEVQDPAKAAKISNYKLKVEHLKRENNALKKHLAAHERNLQERLKQDNLFK
jgi:ribosomal protein L14E/L6E/L27E